MNVVDSSGWLEYFANGANASFFAPAVEEVNKLIVPSIVILEVAKRVMDRQGERDALRVVVQMEQGQVVDLNASLALSAARLGLDLELPLADSVILATARAYSAMIWTQDSDFRGMNGVKYVAKK